MGAKVVLIAVFALFPAMGGAQSCPNGGSPLSEAKVTELAKAVPAPRMRQLVAGCGIEFEPTGDAIGRLRAAGVPDAVLDAVRSSAGPAQRQWNSIMNSQDPAVFADYLSRYPSGQFTDSARQKYRALKVGAMRADMERTLAAGQWDAADREIQEVLRFAPADEDIMSWQRRVADGREAERKQKEQAAVAAAAEQKRKDEESAAAARTAAAQPQPVAIAAVRPAAPVTSPPVPSTRKVNPADGLTYDWIPPGSFTMGCSPGDNQCIGNEKPAHQVTISKGFWLGQTDVTQQVFQRLMEQNPSHLKGQNLPVTVDWELAKEYCGKVGGRLPTEAEWEYAARAGSAAVRYGNLDEIAWYSANSGGQPHEVAQKLPNAYGLFDMIGNVFQWVADWNGSYQAAAQADPAGPASGQWRALRGVAVAYDAGDMRVSFRHSAPPAGLFGFRCAVDAGQ